MLGLPTETDDDIEELVRLTEYVLGIGGKRLNLNVTLSTFVPKPFTPFQWEAQCDPQVIERRLDNIKLALRKHRRLKIMARDPYYSQLECILARGDRKIAQVIFDAWRGGAVFDSWRERFRPDVWEQALSKNSIDRDYYTGAIGPDSALPWEQIDVRVGKAFLLNEREQAYQEVITPDCRSGCIGCGVCDTEKLRMDLVPESPISIDNCQKVPEGIPNKEAEFRYRINYCKTGALRNISHLDLMRLLQQAMRRAGLVLGFTRGYNRRPKMSAGYPLPLGYTAEGEIIEIVLLKETPDIIARLNRNLPPGLVIQSAEPLSTKLPSIFSSVIGFDYEVKLMPKLPANFRDKIREIYDTDQVWIEYLRAGKPKAIDLKKYIETVNLNGQVLAVKTRVVNGKTIRMEELLAHLGLKGGYRVCRKQTYLQNK